MATPIPAAALLLPGSNAGELLRLCARIGGEALPAIHAVASGFLVRLPRPDESAYPGVVRLRALSSNLFVQVDGELTPALLEDEAAALVRQRGPVFLPGGSVLEFSPSTTLSAADLLSVMRVPHRSWRPLPPAPTLADQLTEIVLDIPDPPPDAIVEAGGSGIGDALGMVQQRDLVGVGAEQQDLAAGFDQLLERRALAERPGVGVIGDKPIGAGTARTEADGGSLFVNKTTMEMVYWLLDPMISFIAALRITPNMVTMGSLIPAAGAGVAIGFGWFGTGALLAILATFGDIIDGLLARKTGLSSDAGELVDAAVDRYGEIFFFGGLVYYYRDHDQVLFIVLAALVGSFMVSYATAKAEAMGVTAPRGAMRRGERAAYLIAGATFTPLTSALFAQSPSLALREAPILLALSIVAVVANISVVQRLAAIAALLRERDEARKSAATTAFDDEAMTTKPDAPVGSV